MGLYQLPVAAALALLLPAAVLTEALALRAPKSFYHDASSHAGRYMIYPTKSILTAAKAVAP
jgi:hypothetical protein